MFVKVKAYKVIVPFLGHPVDDDMVRTVMTADPSVTISPSETVATVVHSISFTCNVSGHPLPTVSHWTLPNDATNYAVGEQSDKSRVQVRRFAPAAKPAF